VVLLLATCHVNSKQVIEIYSHVGIRIKIKFDGKNVPLVDVNNGSAINTREIKTQINKFALTSSVAKISTGTLWLSSINLMNR
jgi:hypothetical protein